MTHPKAAVVKKGRTVTAGLLYFQTASYVVLLNNMATKADLGPLRSRRDIHLEPEANITIIPKDSETKVELIEASRGADHRGA
jgi:hypothetical protein